MRLVEAVYRCRLQCNMEQLGKFYGVVSRRRGRVLSDELLEGTDVFIIDAVLPVAESFGFAEELRKKTSGAASSPQLVLSHWEVLQVDPFWRPRTEEELEELGDAVAEKPLARVYAERVRRRKGLVRDDKVVAHAEKQRNLSRKK